jgi:hypothetical protein
MSSILDIELQNRDGFCFVPGGGGSKAEIAVGPKDLWSIWKGKESI